VTASPERLWPTALNETGRITRLLLKHARDAFGGEAAIAGQWRDLRFTAAPDYGRAVAEYESLVEILKSEGAEIRWLPSRGGTGLDSIYVRDASVVCADGVILCSMGKPQRAWEPAAQREVYEAWGVPVAGVIRAPGRLEGGDVVWIDERTVAVGQGYRTNAAGIAQFRDILGSSVDEVIVVPLPHWRGPADVFHLMSIISPVDDDLAVVYSPLMPVPFRETLLARGIRLVEVPDGEFESMGANVLALHPRKCLMVAGNPRTRALLEAAKAEVVVYSGVEISLKGGGGPTCLTRPIGRV
jgi:N-dimethylarginine dimethylaminohydrolase